MGDGEGALSDALRCRMLRPDWAKACYRQAAAHMLLKVPLACRVSSLVTYFILIFQSGHILWSPLHQEYKQACDALLDAQKLDPGNAEIERELR